MFPCLLHLRQLKKEYLIVKALRHLSGFGWDETEQMVTAPEEVWAAYLEVSNTTMSAARLLTPAVEAAESDEVQDEAI